MAVKPVKMFEGLLLANSATTVYTAPTGIAGVVAIKNITVTNSSSSAIHTVYVAIGAATTATTVIVAKPLAPLETQSLADLVNQYISAGSILQMWADTAAVVAAQGSGLILT